MSKIIVALAGLALTSAALAQNPITITPQGNGSANTTNGLFSIELPIGTQPLNNGTLFSRSEFRAGDASSADHTFQTAWAFRAGAGAAEDGREYFFAGGATNSSNAVTQGTPDSKFIRSSRTAVYGTGAGVTNTGGYDVEITKGNPRLANGLIDANGVFGANDTDYHFKSEMRYAITAGTGGNGPKVTATNKITNVDSKPLVLNLFFMNNADLNGTFGDDTIQNSGGNFTVVDGTGPWVMKASAVNPTHYLGNLTSGNSSFPISSFQFLTDGLLNGIRTNLDDNAFNNASAGPGDIEYGYQWTLTLEAGASATYSTQFELVPTPGAAALLGLGGIVAGRRRR